MSNLEEQLLDAHKKVINSILIGYFTDFSILQLEQELQQLKQAKRSAIAAQKSSAQGKVKFIISLVPNKF